MGEQQDIELGQISQATSYKLVGTSFYFWNVNDFVGAIFVCFICLLHGPSLRKKNVLL